MPDQFRISVNASPADIFHNFPIRKGEKSQLIIYGKHSYGTESISIQSWMEGGHLFIGSFCSFADNIKVFFGGAHRTDFASTYPFSINYLFPDGHQACLNGHPRTKGHVIIGNDVWIGQDTCILSGVTIANGAVIGARSVITKNIPAYHIVAGNPARIIRPRFDKALIDELEKLKWWELSDHSINSLSPLLQQSLNVQVMELIITQVNQPPCISKEVRSYQRNQGVQPMNNETDLRRQISW